MKTQVKLVLLCACLLQLVSCAETPAVSHSRQDVRVEYASEGSPRILHAYATVERGHTVVRGELGFPETARYRYFTGTLHATARSTDGRLIELPNATLAPRVKPRIAGRRADFRLDTGQLLRKGTVVTLRYSNRS